MVRPESLRLRPVDDKPQTLTGDLGQIITSVFYGDTIEYEIETEFGTVICVVSDPREDELLDEGRIVRLSVESDKAWLLRSEHATV